MTRNIRIITERCVDAFRYQTTNVTNIYLHLIKTKICIIRMNSPLFSFGDGNSLPNAASSSFRAAFCTLSYAGSAAFVTLKRSDITRASMFSISIHQRYRSIHQTYTQSLFDIWSSIAISLADSRNFTHNKLSSSLEFQKEKNKFRHVINETMNK